MDINTLEICPWVFVPHLRNMWLRLSAGTILDSSYWYISELCMLLDKPNGMFVSLGLHIRISSLGADNGTAIIDRTPVHILLSIEGKI